MPLFRRKRTLDAVGIGGVVVGLSGDGAAHVSELHSPELPALLIASLAPVSLLVELGHRHVQDGFSDALFRGVGDLLDAEDHHEAIRALNASGVHQHDVSASPPGTEAALSGKLFMLDGGRLTGVWEMSQGYKPAAHALRALAALWAAASWANVGNLAFYGMRLTAGAYAEGVDFGNPKVLTDMPSMMLKTASEFDASDRQTAQLFADLEEDD